MVPEYDEEDWDADSDEEKDDFGDDTEE